MQAHDSHDRSPDRPGSAVPQLCGNVFSRIDERRTAVLVGVSGCEPRRMVEGLVRWLSALEPASVELLIDWRALPLPAVGVELDSLHRALESMFHAARGKVVRVVSVTPDDWSRLWWHGVHAFAALECPWALVHDLARACRWLDLPHGFERELSDLGDVRQTVASHVEWLLSTRLEADTEEVARLLSMSPRSMQRALELEGKTFSSLRDRLRLSRASESLRRGDKVEAIAAEVGFASTSHFVRWFRARSGFAPSEFRKLASSVG
jgi:AraC-like DNA-binding protein